MANYFFKTPTNLQTKEHFDSAYEKEIDATRTIVRSRLVKWIAIADPKKIDGFLKEVVVNYNIHGAMFEMTAEKLYAIAGSYVSAEEKVHWLKIWNNPSLHSLYDFPTERTNSSIKEWCDKMTWLWQVGSISLL